MTASTLTARPLWRDAALHFGRISLLLGTLILLVVVRFGMPPYFFVLAVAVSLAAVYFTARAGGDFRV